MTAIKPRAKFKTSEKIKKVNDLVSIIKEARKHGHKVALCHGVFDLVHPGHIVHFKQARDHGDIVIVTVTPDRFVNKGPGRPVFGEQLRLETLAALEVVDYVALNEWPTAVETIRLLKPDAYVKGSDYANASSDVTGKISEEEASVREFGGKIVFTDGFTSSSSHLINRFFSVYPAATQEFLHNFRSRHSASQIIDTLKSLSNLKVLVIGEAILDQYCYCIPMGKSPKETIVSTKFSSEESFAGGAVATANHIGGFCKQVTLLTALGSDRSEAEFMKGKLRGNVRLNALQTKERPTVRKLRFLEPNYMIKMFEIQYLNDAPLDDAVEKQLVAKIETEIRKHDLVVVNDFGHGLLTENLRRLVSSCGKYLALNTQSNSANHGYNTVTNYERADYVAIDEPEMHLASKNKFGDIQALSAKLREHLHARTFLVSRGALGSVVLTDAGFTRAPALATRIVDRTGAGDALFAVTSPLAYRNVSPEILAFIGNCVGALAVEIVCNREPIDPVVLFKFIQTLLK